MIMRRGETRTVWAAKESILPWSRILARILAWIRAQTLAQTLALGFVFLSTNGVLYD